MGNIHHSRFYSECFSYRYGTTTEPSLFHNNIIGSHDMFELILVRSGIGNYSAEGKRYPLQKNCLVVTPPGKIHVLTIESDEQPYERHILMYDYSRLLPELCDAIPANLDMLYLKDDHTIIDLFKRMDRCCHQLQGAEQERLMQILAEELFFYVRLSAGQVEQQNTSINPLIQKTITYIEEHITTLSNINELCEALFVTKGYLHHLFAEQMHITPKKYITSKRLSLAQRAIRAGEKPSKVYLECGFRSYAAFYRDYKLFFGHSPSEELSQPNIPDILL